jgi:putative transposase
VRFILSEGQRSDFTEALRLLEGLKAQAVLADKGYDADYVVRRIEEMGAMVVIPSKENRKEKRPLDEVLYKERNWVERLFNKLKHFRRVTTRYDKLDCSFMSFIALASISRLLK